MGFFTYDCNQDGHKFEARYHLTRPSKISKVEYYSAKELERILDAMSDKEYIHDVCVHCGKIVGQVN